jgi:hypothetical protein
MTFSGKIVRKDGVEICETSGEFHVDSSTGSRGWYGHFILPTGRHVGSDSEYELVLDDGRKGKIVTGDSSIGSHQNTVINFKGSGPPP